MSYNGFEILGSFLQNGCDLEPIVDDRVQQFKREIDYDLIAKANSGYFPIKCDQKIIDYQESHPEAKEIFRSTLVLQKYLEGCGELNKEKPRIVARVHTITEIILRLLNIPCHTSMKLSFRKEGSTIFLEGECLDMKSSDHLNVFRVSQERILRENVFEKEEKSVFDLGCLLQAVKGLLFGKEQKKKKIPVLGETSLYRVAKHGFDNFDLIVSKEVNAGLEDPIEILTVRNDGRINVRKNLLKSVFLGATNKAVVNVIQDDEIIRICTIDDLSLLDCKNDLPRFKQTSAEFFNWLIRFAESVDGFQGELNPCLLGMMATCGDSYALFETAKPAHLRVYSRQIRPKIHNVSSFRMPHLDRNLCDISPGLNIFADPTKRPVIIIADSPVVYKQRPILNRPDYIVILRRYGGNAEFKNKLLNFFVHFHPDIAELRPPQNPLVLVAPAYFKTPYFPKHFHFKRLSPWNCNLNEENYILVYFEIGALYQAIDLHRWIGEQQFVRLTVVCLGPLKFDEATVRQILRRQFCEKTVDAAKVITDVVGNDKVYIPFLCNLFDLPDEDFKFKEVKPKPKKHSSGKKLHLLGNTTINMSKDKCILENGYIQKAFDLQLISDFLKTGLHPYRLTPRKIFVTGTAEEIEQVREKLAQCDVKCRVFEEIVDVS